MKRDFSIHNIHFTIADYRPRKNEYEKGLKYQLLIRIYDGPRDYDYYYRCTGYYGSTLAGLKNIAEKNIYAWL